MSSQSSMSSVIVFSLAHLTYLSNSVWQGGGSSACRNGCDSLPAAGEFSEKTAWRKLEAVVAEKRASSETEAAAEVRGMVASRAPMPGVEEEVTKPMERKKDVVEVST